VIGSSPWIEFCLQKISLMIPTATCLNFVSRMRTESFSVVSPGSNLWLSQTKGYKGPKEYTQDEVVEMAEDFVEELVEWTCAYKPDQKLDFFLGYLVCGVISHGFDGGLENRLPELVDVVVLHVFKVEHDFVAFLLGEVELGVDVVDKRLDVVVGLEVPLDDLVEENFFGHVEVFNLR
jgi:hypothetical protein